MLPANGNKTTLKIPLQLILSIPFIILIIIIVALVGYLSFQNGQRAVNDVVQQLETEISARIKAHVQTFLATPHHINELNARFIESGWLNPTDPDALETHFWQQINIFETVTSIYMGNTRGGLVNSGREGADNRQYVIVTDNFASGPFNKYAVDSRGNRTELLTSLPNFDARTRPWYLAAIENDGPVWSDLYLLFTGQDMAISASRPIYNGQGDLLGVVAVDIFTSALNDFLKDIEVGQTGQSFIIERSGLLVASSTGEAPFTDPAGPEPQTRLYASQSASPLVKTASQALVEQFGDYANITQTQQLNFQANGQSYFMQVTPVQDPYGIDWLIVVIIPQSDFLTQINANNRLTFLLTIIAIVFASLTSILIARRIARPISALNISAQTLAHGSPPQADIATRIAEISALSHSFNTMARQITAESSRRKQTEENLRTIIENMPVMLDAFDEQGNIIAWNKECEYITGYSAAEIIGNPQAMELLYPDAAYRQEMTEAWTARGNNYYHWEWELTAKDGSTKTIAWSSISEKFPVPGWTTWGIGVDVTERKESEQALQNYAHQLEALSQIDRAILAAQSPLEIANGALNHILQLVPCIRATINQVDVETGIVTLLAVYSHRPTKIDVGSRLPLRDMQLSTLFQQGQIIIIDDLTIYDQLSDVKHLLNEGVKACVAIPLMVQERVVGGISFGRAEPASFSPADMEILQQIAAHLAIALHQASLHEQVKQHAAELEGHVAARTQELQERLLELESMNVAMSNLLADLQAANQKLRFTASQLESANAELSSFSYSVSHDLRAPLRHIDGFASLLAMNEYIKEDETSARYLSYISQATAKMSQLIDDLLSFSRAGRAEMNIRPTDLNALIQSVQAEALLSYPGREIEWRIASLPTVKADAKLLGIVWYNLLDNALKYSANEPQTRIEIGLASNVAPPGKTKPAKNKLTLFIRDNGAGFDPQYAPKIFGVFERLHAESDFPGTGIGLATVQRIIQRHGGEIWAESKIDQGATFYFTLPL